METRNHVGKYINLVICLSLLLPKLLFSEDADVAIILKASGKVSLKKIERKDWLTGKTGQRLNSGDVIKTEENSVAAIMFTDDKSLIKVRDNSTIAIKGKREQKSITKRIFCTVGNFWIKAAKQTNQMLVETPSGVAAIKGSAATFTVTPAETKIVVSDGVFELFNTYGKILIQAGETGKITREGQPIKYKSTPEEQQGAQDDGGFLENEIRLEFEKDSQTKTLKIKYKENNN